MRRISAFAVPVLLGVGSLSVHAQTLYSVASSPGAPLLAIDPASAKVRTVATTTGATQAAFGPSAIDAEGRRLFFFGAPGGGSTVLPGIFTVDLTSGTTTSHWIQGSAGPIRFLEYDPVTRKLLFAGNTTGAPVASIDPETGILTTLLPATGSTGAFASAIDPAGRRFFFTGAVGITGGSVNTLFTVDLATLAVSSRPIAVDSLAFFRYDAASGSLIGVSNAPGVPVVSIDPNTGLVTTLVASTGAVRADFGALDPAGGKLYFESLSGLTQALFTVDLPARTASHASIARTDGYVFLQLDPLGQRSACGSDLFALCLNQGRFSARVAWKPPSGIPTAAVPLILTPDTGAFWFLSANNIELVVKVVDGRVFNGRFWVFVGALTDIEYTVTVTDTLTGTEKSYSSPAGHLASFADTAAF
jgi:hypothetical protein